MRESFGAPDENQALAERLLVVLSGPRFGDQSSVERRAYFDGLVALGGHTVIATLTAWAGLWSIGGTKDTKARRELAAAALARMNDPEAQAALKKLAKSLVPAVRNASRRALGQGASEEQAA